MGPHAPIPSGLTCTYTQWAHMHLYPVGPHAPIPSGPTCTYTQCLPKSFAKLSTCVHPQYNSFAGAEFMFHTHEVLEPSNGEHQDGDDMWEMGVMPATMVVCQNHSYWAIQPIIFITMTFVSTHTHTHTHTRTHHTRTHTHTHKTHTHLTHMHTH